MLWLPDITSSNEMPLLIEEGHVEVVENLLATDHRHILTAHGLESDPG